MPLPEDKKRALAEQLIQVVMQYIQQIQQMEQGGGEQPPEEQMPEEGAGYPSERV